MQRHQRLEIWVTFGLKLHARAHCSWNYGRYRYWLYLWECVLLPIDIAFQRVLVVIDGDKLSVKMRLIQSEGSFILRANSLPISNAWGNIEFRVRWLSKEDIFLVLHEFLVEERLGPFKIKPNLALRFTPFKRGSIFLRQDFFRFLNLSNRWRKKTFLFYIA